MRRRRWPPLAYRLARGQLGTLATDPGAQTAQIRRDPDGARSTLRNTRNLGRKLAYFSTVIEAMLQDLAFGDRCADFSDFAAPNH
jgi:hypothetical protein